MVHAVDADRPGRAPVARVERSHPLESSPTIPARKPEMAKAEEMTRFAGTPSSVKPPAAVSEVEEGTVEVPPVTAAC